MNLKKGKNRLKLDLNKMKKNEYVKMHRLENYHFWFAGKRYFIQIFLDQIKSQINKILDVGSGTGGTTKFLQSYGKVTGIEKNSLAIKLAKPQKLKIIQGEAENLPFNKGTFDLVTLFDVLYHQEVRSVNKVINEAKRVSKPSGYLLITDSALEILSGKHGRSVFEKRRFTLKDLENQLTKNGFAVIRSSYIFLSMFPLIFLKRVIIDKLIDTDRSDVFSPPDVINSLFKAVLKAEAFLLYFFKLPMGSSLIILATKKRDAIDSNPDL